MNAKADIRADFVHRARFIPKTFLGFASIAGYFVAIGAFVVLLNNDFGWIWPSTILGVSIVVVWMASGAIQRKFERDAQAAGFAATEIRNIEDEAERLNDEEYP